MYCPNCGNKLTLARNREGQAKDACQQCKIVYTVQINKTFEAELITIFYRRDKQIE